MSLMNIATNIKENSSDGTIFDGKLTRLWDIRISSENYYHLQFFNDIIDEAWIYWYTIDLILVI